MTLDHLQWLRGVECDEGMTVYDRLKKLAMEAAVVYFSRLAVVWRS